MQSFFYTGGCAYTKDCIEFETGCVRCKDYKRQCNSWVFNRTRYNWKEMYQALHSIEHLMGVAVSPWVEERMIQSKIARDLSKCTIMNGIDTDVFKYKVDNEDKLKIIQDILDEDTIKQKVTRSTRFFLHVTSYFTNEKTDLKGGWYVIQLAKRLQNLDILFLVAGNINIANIDDIPDNIVLLGSISNQEMLADLYNIAEVNLITSQRETFGMTCAESLCCGTPIIGFKNGGSDSIALEEGTFFVEYGQIDLIEGKLRESKLMSNPDRRILSELSKEAYSKEKIAQKYGELYEQMLGGSKEKSMI